MRGFPKTQMGLFAAAVCLAAAFFALDLALPLGVAGGVPYVALVLLGWWLDRPRYLVLLGAVSTVLTIAGYYFSAAGGIEWMVLTNRALAFFAIWTTVGLLAKAKISEIALRDAHDELEQQAEALRDSEKRFRSLYHKTPVMMHSIGTDGRLISVSDYWLQVLGYERDEVIGRRATDFLAEESKRRAFDEVLPKLYRTGSAQEVPYQFATKGGKIIDVLLSAIMERDAAGEGRHSLTVLVDVTERKRAEEALRESEARYARAMSGTNDGLWDWDIQTDESYRSPRWEEIVGHGPGELEPVRQTMVDLTHPDDRQRMLDATRAHLEARVPYDIEIRLRHKSDEYIWVRIRGQAIWDADDKPLRMAGSLTDITPRKHAEEQIRKLNETLEERVEARTAELRAAQDALLRKERLAALGQLTGTVAHELRNPLGTIANAISVIRHKCAGAKPDLEKTLARAERNIERCDTIITELLDFARAKGLQPEPTVVDAWLAEVLEEQHIPETITVTRDFQADAAAVAFDRDELRRAVINLVDNACQAMTGGEKRADAGTGDSGSRDAGTRRELVLSTRMNGERLEIAVADTGPGIPAEVLPQVLEPLFSTKTFGTGLGLPTVQRIMEAHGGGLEITSKEHCGTKVVLWLPLGQPRDGGAAA